MTQPENVGKCLTFPKHNGFFCLFKLMLMMSNINFESSKIDREFSIDQCNGIQNDRISFALKT